MILNYRFTLFMKLVSSVKTKSSKVYYRKSNYGFDVKNQFI